MNLRMRRRGTLVRAASYLILACTGTLAHSAGDTVAEHIRRITNAIPPAMIVQGEPPKPVTLTDRMVALRVPGVSIAVIHHGRLEWARGFGVAKVGGAPVTAETLFQAASISKPITALAVLRLVDTGKISLDADANDYLRSWKLPENEFTAKQKVTVRELLSHTAGITVPGFGGYYAGDPLPTLRQTLDGEPPANNPPIRVDIVPDTAWRYAGGGYVILRQILEDQTGLPFAQVLQESVLAPIGMTHSTFQQPLSAVALAAVAVPHDRRGRPVTAGPKVYPEMAPDGLWSTPSDLARYVIEVQRSLAGKRGSLLSSATAHSMLTARLNPYGLGAIVGDDAQHPWFTHNGGNYGYPCLFVAYNKDEGAVVMSNGANGFDLDVDILRSIAQEYNWPDFKSHRHHILAVDAQALAPYVGVYELSEDRFAAVFKNEKGLSFQSTDHVKQPIFALASGKFVLREPSVNYFFSRDDETKLRFKTDEQGKVTEMTLVGGTANGEPAKRLPDPQAGPILAQMASTNQRFESQVAAPQGERLLRQLITDISVGRLDEQMVTPALGKELKSLRDLNQQVFNQLGPVVSMSFAHTTGTGIDTYHVLFKNGEAEMDIWLDNDGKLKFVRYFAS